MELATNLKAMIRLVREPMLYRVQWANPSTAVPKLQTGRHLEGFQNCRKLQTNAVGNDKPFLHKQRALATTFGCLQALKMYDIYVSLCFLYMRPPSQQIPKPQWQTELGYIQLFPLLNLQAEKYFIFWLVPNRVAVKCAVALPWKIKNEKWKYSKFIKNEIKTNLYQYFFKTLLYSNILDCK